MRPAAPLRLPIGLEDPPDLIEGPTRRDRSALTGAAVDHEAVMEWLGSIGGDARN